MMYDFAVIGGGPAGYSAALEGVAQGLKVVLFEQDMLGGTCLNRGCVPTKHLAHAAELYTKIKDAEDYGILSEKPAVDFEAVMRRKQEIILQLRTGLEQMMRQKKIEIIQGKAEIVRRGVLSCAGRVYEASNILIATGSVSAEPLVGDAISSNELLELDHIPETMVILGGGVVAVEFAHIFSSLGTKVTMCIRGERLLRKWDRELAIGVTQSLKKKGVSVLTNCSIDQMKEQKAEIVLSATGRVPNIEGIFDKKLGLVIENGIVVDQYGFTGVPGIYAAGDVISNSYQLAHVGMEQGKRVAKHIVGKNISEPATVVSCIYVQPEVVTVGLDEAEAKKREIAYVAAKQTMYSNARTMISGGERGFIKLLANVSTHEILGAQLMCERASDIAGELAFAINQKLTVEKLAASVRPHPSFCEAVTEVAENLLEKLKWSISI